MIDVSGPHHKATPKSLQVGRERAGLETQVSLPLLKKTPIKQRSTKACQLEACSEPWALNIGIARQM